MAIVDSELSYSMRKQRHPNFIGKKFYKLTVQSWDENTKRWQCLCDCGKTRFVPTGELNRHNFNSCGCGYRHQPKRLANNLSIKRRIINSYCQNAKKRKLSFSLSEEQFIHLMELPCFYCGEMPSLRYKFMKFEHNYLYNGIDRINSKEGYTIKNCVPCCSICNVSKSNLSLDKCKKWIEKIYNNFIVGQQC